MAPFGCVLFSAPFGCVDFMHPKGAYVHMHVCALSGTHILCAHVCTLSGTHMCERVHVCTLSGTHMCERVHVHVSAPCGCVISFFEAHSPLHSEARETTLRVGSASLPKTHLLLIASRASRFPTCTLGPKKKSRQGGVRVMMGVKFKNSQN